MGNKSSQRQNHMRLAVHQARKMRLSARYCQCHLIDDHLTANTKTFKSIQNRAHVYNLSSAARQFEKKMTRGL